MMDTAFFLPKLPSVNLFEVLAVLTIPSIAHYLVFNNFEKHLPVQRRITKLIIVVGVLAIIGILFGRVAFWGVITLITIGTIYLHGVYFPQHRINGLPAEPYDKYLETIERMKGNKS